MEEENENENEGEKFPLIPFVTLYLGLDFPSPPFSFLLTLFFERILRYPQIQWNIAKVFLLLSDPVHPPIMIVNLIEREREREISYDGEKSFSRFEKSKSKE